MIFIIFALFVLLFTYVVIYTESFVNFGIDSEDKELIIPISTNYPFTQ